MKIIQKMGVLFVLLTFAVTMPAALPAQEVTGELGSPSATTTIDGKQLPPLSRKT